MVKFAGLDLLDDFLSTSAASTRCSARNVLIYFDQPTQRRCSTFALRTSGERVSYPGAGRRDGGRSHQPLRAYPHKRGLLRPAERRCGAQQHAELPAAEHALALACGAGHLQFATPSFGRLTRAQR